MGSGVAGRAGRQGRWSPSDALLASTRCSNVVRTPFAVEGFHVANIKSQKKRILTDAKRAERNKAVRSELKTRAKNAVRDAGTDTGDEAMRLAVKRLDMAAAKKVIHKNQAARRKSRLMKKINAVTAASTTSD
jgi:small subunit ribosomal protein S20